MSIKRQAGKWLAGMALMAAGIGVASAHSSLSIAVGVPLGGVYYGGGGYYAPPPPPPVYYAPAPVYYAPPPPPPPVYYAPAPVYYGGGYYRGPGPGRHYDHYDRRYDDRRYDRGYRR